MYCEYLLVDYMRESSESRREKIRNELFVSNYGIVYSFALSFGIPRCDRADFEQLCFIAFVKAIDYYCRKGDAIHSFMSYYRRCALHEYYIWRLKNKYPFCANTRSADRIASTICLEYQDDLQNYITLDELLHANEEAELSKIVWELVNSCVCQQQYIILCFKYQCQMTYKDIGRMLNTNAQFVRQQCVNAFRKLYRCKSIRDIAHDYYDITIR